MDRKTLIDLLDDFAFGSHDIEQTADRITELYKETQALQLQQTGVMQSVLKASDLRIGNLIAFGKQCCKVYEIQENCFYVIGEKERSFKNTSFELEPIKLNENWLLNFGFKRFPWGLVKDNLLFKDDLKCSYLILQVGNGFEVKVKYVHEFQNLYFALTGSELTVA